MTMQDQLQTVADTMKSLSPHQLETVTRMRACDRKIERWPGGFWTTPGMTKNLRGAPMWYVTTQTITSLERRGVVKESKFGPSRIGKFVVEYKLVWGF